MWAARGGSDYPGESVITTMKMHPNLTSPNEGSTTQQSAAGIQDTGHETGSSTHALAPTISQREKGIEAFRWIPGLSTSTLLQIVPLAGIFFLTFFHSTDPDLWWHLATGRYIVETGTIPHVDPFSYTAAGKPWVAHEWLSEVIMFVLYRAHGYLVPVLLFASVIALTYAITLQTLKVLGLKPVAAVSITFWAAFMSLFSWNVRPQIFSYFLSSIYIFLLVRSRKRRDRWIWLLPAIMVLWVNLHAGYVVGLILLGLFILGEGVNQGRAKWMWVIRRYLAVAAATILVTVLNPQGPAMLLYPFSYAGTQNASMRFISEWQSPDFHYYYFFVFGLSLMALMIIPSRRGIDWALALPLLTLTAMSLQSVRVIPFYALSFAPLLASRIDMGRWREAKWALGSQGIASETVPLERGPSTQRPNRGSRWNWLVLGLCLSIMASTLFLSDRTQWGPEPRTDDYPVAGVRYLKESGLRGNLFNSFQWGGFLIWSFYPERRVFVDGRPDMYGDQFIEGYRRVQEALPGWKEVLNRYHVTVALVVKDSQIATLLAASGDWREAFSGKIESVFVRIPSRNGDVGGN